MHHYFIGIKAPDSVEGLVMQYREKYGLSNAYKVIPHMEDLHITLLFIGALSEQKVEPLQETLSSLAEKHREFLLNVDGLSFFGSPKGPRVVYLSVQPSKELDALQKAVAAIGVNQLKMEPDHRFTPHITIAKKRKIDGELHIQKETSTPIQFHVDRFSLFRIHPSKTPKYEAVESFSLQKPSE
ncbi:RNA 2',3'-cyclic phosphodiesterase [Sporosarcina sp. ACRSL]|uniref:RNA 2',3'-cyclic phosphodiesterase n=1 Tax=Sporosarcina sp. ACRSL TaxID=2918215 RepID=UPI001EF4EBB7|nr:RNA 2',3'-cyclic phosphodiesterase [Sporosarcina sp. ACRSL]MCG7344589.1 RNA 2',3'-cyclic phosphodiesterase [Sporosarcina sp. ACRSL]